MKAGRFAPSPTGPLHAGSLATALASYLDAKAHGLRWLVRMEDLDPPREQAGAAERILQQLQDHGLQWDGEVLFQSSRHAAYEAALTQLKQQGRVFGCTCSRRQLQAIVDQGLAERLPEGEVRYPGTCRTLSADASGCAWRFLSPAGEDDFILKRADGYWAYHLAVVVDDAHQQVERIVRGSDLAGVLHRHRWLQAALALPEPEVLHVPVICNAQGEKLSKQTQAPALSGGDAVHGQLRAAWQHLETVMPRAWLDQACQFFG